MSFRIRTSLEQAKYCKIIQHKNVELLCSTCVYKITGNVLCCLVHNKILNKQHGEEKIVLISKKIEIKLTKKNNTIMSFLKKQ